MLSRRQRLRSHKSTDEPHAGKLARVVLARDPGIHIVLTCVGPCNSRQIFMARKQILSGKGAAKYSVILESTYIVLGSLGC